MARIVESDSRQISTAVDLAVHFILTVVLAGFFYWLTGRWIWPALAVVGGILIDIDHFIDYYRYFGIRFNARDFFGHKYLASGKCYVILHSWELVLCVWILSLFFAGVTPLAAGMTLHMVIDHWLSHRKTPRFLFLLYRWRRGFELPEDGG